MIIGHDVAVGADNHAASRGFFLRGLHSALLRSAVSAVGIAEEAERTEEVAERVFLYFHRLHLGILHILNMNHCRECLLRSISQVYRLPCGNGFDGRSRIRFDESSGRKAKCSYAHGTKNILTIHFHNPILLVYISSFNFLLLQVIGCKYKSKTKNIHENH